jgi:hypothetical protein
MRHTATQGTTTQAMGILATGTRGIPVTAAITVAARK